MIRLLLVDDQNLICQGLQYVTHLLNRLTLKNRSQLAIYANAIASDLDG
jgi:DNA-binding NarL/FixJ family response regulator